MNGITILKMGTNIIVPLQDDIHDRDARDLQAMILQKIQENSSSGLLIDVSALTIIDSFLGRLIGETAKMANIMGAETVLVGLKKEVVFTLIHLGLKLKDLNTALNLEEGLILLEKLKIKKKRSHHEFK